MRAMLRATGLRATGLLAICWLALASCTMHSNDTVATVNLTLTDPVCLQNFAFSDPAQWQHRDRSLELLGKSDYQPPFRSPTSIALLRLLECGDFDLDADLLQTGRAYGHRDLCMFFGFESPSRFYYVHLATSPDQHAHNIFLVDNAARTALATVPSKGVDWGQDAWHHVRIERRLADGSIRVYWDRREEPILEAFDTTLGFGRVGFGSFDDSGRMRDLRITAPDGRFRRGTDPFAR